MSAIAYIGKLALSAILPTSVTAVASLSASLSAVEPVISADLSAAVAAEASITADPPNLAALVAQAETDLIALEEAAAQLPPLPFVSFQATALASLVDELTPIVASISASLALGLPLQTLFLEGNVQAFSFSGSSSQLGGLISATVGAGLPDGSGAKSALTGFVLAATGGGTWAGMQAFFPPLPGSQSSGTLVALGGLGVGELVALLSSGVLAATAMLTLQLATLQARLDGAIAASATVSLGLPDVVQLAEEMLAALQLPPASFIAATVAVAAMVSLVASLTALVASLSAQVTALAAITTALSTAGVLAFTYSGTAEDFAGAIASAVGAGWPDGTPSSSASNALILLASGTGTGAALSTLFGGL